MKSWRLAQQSYLLWAGKFLAFSVLWLALTTLGNSSIHADTPSSAAMQRSEFSTTTSLPTPIAIVPPIGGDGDEYGNAIAMDGDLLVVGAFRTTVDGRPNQGAVYLFAREPANPLNYAFVKQLVASDGQAHDWFGWSVAIYGDTVVVGATHTDPDGHTNIGGVYVYERNHGGPNNWGQVTKLYDENHNEFSIRGYLGASVAIHGDTIVAGARLGPGYVFIYERNEGGPNNWGQVQTLLPQTGQDNVEFGETLVFNGELLAVGAPGTFTRPIPRRNVGAVYLYEHDGNGWVQTAHLAIAGDDPSLPYEYGGSFGRAIGMTNDTIYVGAPFFELNDRFGVGKVFAFQYNSVAEKWSLSAEYEASDGDEFDHLGVALYAVEGGAFAASDKGPNDTVYFFPNSITASADSPHQSMTEAYSFSVEDDVVGSNLGSAFGGNGNTFVIGASGYDSSRGALFSYPLDALLAVEPENPTPPIDEPIFPIAYLPMVIQKESGLSFPPTGTLANNGVVKGPGGVKLGALATSLPKDLIVTIAETSAPSKALPGGVTAKGNFYYLGANQDMATSMQKPLLVGIPVPDGIDTGHLALAILTPPGLDRDNDELVWQFLDGLYDENQGLFLTTLSILNTTGNRVILAEHPQFQSPPNNGSAVHSAARGWGAFTVGCTGFAVGECTADIEQEVASFLDSVHKRMSSSFGFTDKPRLRGPITGLVLESGNNSLQLTEGFTAYIYPRTAVACEGNGGLYQPELGNLILCYSPGAGITNAKKLTLIHEYFHSVQYSYSTIYDLTKPYIVPLDAWVIEGTAAAVEASYTFDDEMARTPTFIPLHYVDISLETGVWGDKKYDEYEAQDFWVYVGQRFDRNLSYLHKVFNIGGGFTAGAAIALETEFGVPFNRIYWGWVKNHVIENTYGLGDDLGESCKFNPLVVTPGTSPILWKYHPSERLEFPWDKDKLWEQVQPLHAMLIEIEFPTNMTGAIIETRWEACQGLVSDSLTACQQENQQKLHAKIYVNEEADCELDPLPIEGKRSLSELSSTNRYFILLANADQKAQQGFAIILEPQF